MKFIWILFFVPFLFSCNQKERHQPEASSFQDPRIPPANCIQWYDGCNTCKAEGQQILACTKMVCFTMNAPRCLKFKDGPSKTEVRQSKCKKSGGAWQRKRNGAWVCMYPTKDVNLPCDTSQECQGVCLYYKGKKRGFCSRHTPFIGCAQEYENGKHFNICE